MTIRVFIPNGVMRLAESKAVCPECDRKIPFEEIESKFMKKKEEYRYIRMKCKCKIFIGITQDMRGDFVAFEL